jgi:hypothetical protein
MDVGMGEAKYKHAVEEKQGIMKRLRSRACCLTLISLPSLARRYRTRS